MNIHDKDLLFIFWAFVVISIILVAVAIFIGCYYRCWTLVPKLIKMIDDNNAAARKAQLKAAQARKVALEKAVGERQCQWGKIIVHISKYEKQRITDGLGGSILNSLLRLRARLEISFPQNLDELLGDIYINLTNFTEQGLAPASSRIMAEILGHYQQIFVLGNTEVSRTQFMGGGFGLRGAATGMLIAGLLNGCAQAGQTAKLNNIRELMHKQATLAYHKLEMLRLVVVAEPALTMPHIKFIANNY